MSWSGREPNTLFQSRGDGTFDEVGNVLGVYLRTDSRGAAAADLDGDGDLDLVVYSRNNPTLTVYRNDTPGQGRVALVDLRGTDSEPLASGAQAVARCDGHAQLRQVELGTGFLSQAPPTLHFGLGDCSGIDTLEVIWPSGRKQEWADLPANRHFTLVEGDRDVVSRRLHHRNYNRDELAPEPGELSAVRPALSFERLDGPGTLALAELDGTTAVINFWATWCVPCAVELPELEALHQAFSERGVRFLGVSLDEGRPVAAVQAFLESRGISYQQLWGNVQQQRPFASLGSSPPGAIPITAVLHLGMVRDVHVGKIDAMQLRQLLERLVGPGEG